MNRQAWVSEREMTMDRETDDLLAQLEARAEALEKTTATLNEKYETTTEILDDLICRVSVHDKQASRQAAKSGRNLMLEDADRDVDEADRAGALGEVS